MGLALGKSLAEVYAMGAAEISVWLAYRKAHGFPVDRLANGTAIAAAYLGTALGGKADPPKLLARFGVTKKRKQPDDLSGVKAWFDARMKKG